MKITDKKYYEPIKFIDLEVGDVFKCDDAIFMKISKTTEDTFYTAINMRTSNRIRFIDKLVERLDAELIIKGGFDYENRN